MGARNWVRVWGLSLGVEVWGLRFESSGLGEGLGVWV